MGILDTPERNAVIAMSATPVQIYGGASATEKVAGTTVLPAGKIKPDSMLRISGLCNFALPNNAGRAALIYINDVQVGFSYPVATLGGLMFQHEFFVLPDLSGVVSYGSNLNDVTAPTNGQGAPFSAHTALKTVTTVDLTGAATVEIRLRPQNTDIAELTAWAVENLALASPVMMAPITAVACWGDSLTAGTGASTSARTSYPGRLLVNDRPGKTVANLGVGGQTCAQIKARVLADKMRGKHWTCIFQMGRNDVGVAADLAATVVAAVTDCKNNLSHARYLVGSVFSGAAETVGTSLRTQITACNTALAAAFGAHYVDTQAVLLDGGAEIPIAYRAVTAAPTATYLSGVNTVTVSSATGIVNGMFVSGTGIPDQTTITIDGSVVTLSQATTGAGTGATLSFVAATEVHLNDTAYALIATAYSDALTANGW